MITFQLVGWLGNQMFQYACAKALAKKQQDEFYLDADPLFHDTREYELGIFNISEHLASCKERKWYQLFWKNVLMYKIRYILKRFMKKIDPYYFIENDKHPVVHISMYDYQVKIENLENTKAHKRYFEWFRQSEKYFTNIKDEIRQDFTLKAPLDDPKNLATIAAMKQHNSISVHVRRSDYIGSYFAGIATPAYYENALAYIKSNIPAPTFFVFSDDIAWCKEHLPVGNEAYFIDRNTGVNSYKDLVMMSNCKHNIIANSSFSRRGAWLNDNSDKIVIAPQKRHQNLDYKDIVPAERIRI